jgi:hypothetical protein
MADEPADDERAPAPEEQAPELYQPRSVRRTLVLGLAFVLPTAAIALSIFFIVKGGPPRAPLPVASNVEPVTDAAPPPGVAVPNLEDGVPSLSKAAPADSTFEDEGPDQEAEAAPAKKEKPKHFATVQEAAAGTCSTEAVDGLSRQIIEQARCIKPNDFVALPKRPNLVMAAHVYPYLEVGTRDHLLKALDAHTNNTMTINSALRTVAQQYLVSHWAMTKICGVQLATPPGESNHEIGTALDIAEAAKWRPALEAQEFKWLGTSDRVHFDYKGSTAPPKTATDVLAFQKLWNRNHKEDAIPESGLYGPPTEQRLKKAPPGGFALGASCHGASARKR